MFRLFYEHMRGVLIGTVVALRPTDLYQ